MCLLYTVLQKVTKGATCLCRFHVYQYMMYTLSMWNSYLFVASLDIFIVVLAGLISIFSARRSQKTIEKVSQADVVL